MFKDWHEVRTCVFKIIFHDKFDFRESETERKKTVFQHVFQKSTDYHDRPTLDLGSC